MEWRTDPPPKKENEFILAIFDKEIPCPHVVFWSSMWAKGAWIFVHYDYIEEDPIYWTPITMPKQRRPQ